MKRNRIQLISYFLIVALLATMTVGVVACKSKPATTPAPAPTLSSIAVTPASPDNLAVGSTQQFTAIGTYSNGSTADITSQVTWASSDTNVATVSSSGLVTAVAEGTTSITASMSWVTSPAVTLTVVAAAPALSSVEVKPVSPDELAVGATLQFTATGTYSDGSTADVTSQVTWASSDTSIATVSEAGLATGVAAGTAEITASLSGVTSPAVTLKVAAPAPTLSSIAVTPQSPGSLAVDATLQFTATGTYSDGSTADITSQVTWASSNTDVATVSESGLVTGVAAGTTEITAALSGVTSPVVTLEVTAP